MRLGIMQPYFFPYLGHFALIAQTDHWVVFDVSQYTPKSWMTRNRVFHPDQGWNYVSVPLANGSLSIRTWQARVADVRSSHRSLLGKLSHYRRQAPFYKQVVALVDRVFAAVNSDSLVQLNILALREVCEYLGILFDYSICSQLKLDLSGVNDSGAWAPIISRQLGASHYLNPLGGRDLFDVQRFRQIGIELVFFEFDSFSYDTGSYVFEEGLSILDVLMWNTPEQVRHILATQVRMLSA